MSGHSRYAAARKWLLFWTLFIGIGAVGGALMMLLDPSGRIMGMDAMLRISRSCPLLTRCSVISGLPDGRC